jgi:HEAT repeat protein
MSGGIEMKLHKLEAVAAVWLLLILSASPRSQAESKRDEAWDILKSNVNEKSAEKSAVAIRVLELLPGDPEALELAQKAATDDRPDVRAAAAIALGQLHGKSTDAILHKLLSDPEPSVALAAASALMPSKDPAAFEVYYEILTGERKTGNGIIAEQMKTLKDPKKLAELGVEGGIGFIPFAGIGLTAFQTLRVDDVSPVRAAAAKMLTNDPDPESGHALVAATTDKSWLVKAASLEAIAKRGDPKLLDGILPALMDDNTAVRCTAAAAVIRLSTLANARTVQQKKVESISK